MKISDELKEKLENGEIYYVPFHSGKGHFYLSAKGLSKLFKKSEEEKMQDFKVGETVRNTNKKSDYFGMTGKIDEVWESSCLVDFNGYKVACHKENLEKVEIPKEELKVGDKVKHIGEEKHLNGRKGKVLEVIDHSCLVEFDMFTKIVCNKKILEKVEDKQELFELKEGMKFKYLEDNRVYIVSTIDGQEVWNTDGSWDYMETINWEETRKLNEVKEDPKRALIEFKEKRKEILEKLEKLGYRWPNGMKPTEHMPRDTDYLLFNENTKEIFYGSTKLKYDYILSEEVFLNNYMIEKPKEEPKQKEYMIFNPKGNAPRKIHNSLESAEKEVERLINIQSNQEFYILEIVKKAKGQVKIEWE